MTQTHTTPIQKDDSKSSGKESKHLEANNKRALELLLRMQAQLEAARTIGISFTKENNYE